MKMPTQPFTVNRPDLAGVTATLTRKGYDEHAIHTWFNTPSDHLVIAGEPLSPKQWLLSGGSTRRVGALANIAPRKEPTTA